MNSVRHYSAPPDGIIPAAKQKYVPSSGTYPKGFLVSGTHVGVKPTNKSTPDLAFLASETPCAAAAVFTKNKFQAAPVTVSREMLKRRNNSGVRSVIINSGCANAVTGKGGMEDAEKMGVEADKCFEAPNDGKGGSTIVMSTGVIGQRQE
jgi:glutamate N-acetyltransferase/amino-acid N-acetyltransferase